MTSINRNEIINEINNNNVIMKNNDNRKKWRNRINGGEENMKMKKMKEEINQSMKWK